MAREANAHWRSLHALGSRLDCAARFSTACVPLSVTFPRATSSPRDVEAYVEEVEADERRACLKARLGTVNSYRVNSNKHTTEHTLHEHKLRQSDRHTLRLRGTHTDDILCIAGLSEWEVDERCPRN